jgi:hypothetical protein
MAISEAQIVHTVQMQGQKVRSHSTSQVKITLTLRTNKVYSDNNAVNSVNSRFIPTRLTDISDRDEERTSSSSVSSIHNSGTKQRSWLKETVSRKLDEGLSLGDNDVKTDDEAAIDDDESDWGDSIGASVEEGDQANTDENNHIELPILAVSHQGSISQMVCQTDMPPEPAAASPTAPARQNCNPLEAVPGFSGKDDAKGNDDGFDIVFDAPKCYW